MSTLILNSVIRAIGFTQGGWRHPSAKPEGALDLDYYREYAALSERGLFDGLFVANTPAVPDNDWAYLFSPLEPVSLLSALAPSTSHIGLIATVSSTFTHPYNIARQIATLDHLSGGRAGVNIVTTGSESAGRNFGFDALPPHADRYERADEYIDVLLRLWDSWGDDAIVLDKAAGVQVNTASVVPIDHRGTHFAVKGPLDTPRSPHGRPLLFQSGASDRGRQLAAKYADAVYSVAQDIRQARDFRSSLHALQRGGTSSRPPVKVLPGLIPIVGSTQREAERLHEEISSLNPPERGIAALEQRLGIDLGGIELDSPFPVDRLPDLSEVEGSISSHEAIRRFVTGPQITLRHVLRVTDAGNSHLRFVGSPEFVADRIEEWFTTGAADGFNINPAITPSGLADFVEHVVPLLQEKGIYKRAYEGAALRAAFA
ncbi:LLM class flavin-dependent oxidoreductase [Rhodococcus rhodochrous]|uniref:LLM class flavin-dependent oxidoreductase n=1 Tax=Rhodococcus rhodochrous TaxID=1829 RepID=A0AA47ABU0_RHORH|nr:LLM class flavin-dependent oxidoreductase [Rhodococcus rhodochrous]UZF46686.1 LLM class flavin-dependent oxidoreductase [Rhodococcus rhodochrous]